MKYVLNELIITGLQLTLAVPVSGAKKNAWLPYHRNQAIPGVQGSSSQESVKLSSNETPLLCSMFLL